MYCRLDNLHRSQVLKQPDLLPGGKGESLLSKQQIHTTTVHIDMAQ